MQVAHTLESAVFASLDALLAPHTTPPHLAIAVSGGADSVALALLAKAYAVARGGAVVALTVDHRLRAESTDEAATVARWMHAHGIAHYTLTPAHTPTSNNLQEAARHWRYDALAEWCRDHGMLHCLIAHHAGDNRETLLHQQQRDATTEQAGMARVRHHHGVRFLRPLLTMEHTQLEDYLRSKNQSWIEDPSNQNPRFTRVRHRTLLQENAALNAEADATLLQQREARTAHDHALAKAATHCVTLHPLGYATLDLPRWHTLSPDLRTALLADCLVTVSGATHRPRFHETERLSEALLHPITCRTLLQCELVQKGNLLHIAREPARVEAPCLLQGKAVRRWDQRFAVRHDLALGVSLILRALGRDGRKQLGHEGKHLPLATPSLWHLDELVHVPYMKEQKPTLNVTIGFAPPKPLADAPFW